MVIAILSLVALYIALAYLFYWNMVDKALDKTDVQGTLSAIPIMDPLPGMVIVKSNMDAEEMRRVNAHAFDPLASPLPHDGLIVSTSLISCSSCSKMSFPETLDVMHLSGRFLSTRRPWKRLQPPSSWLNVSPVVSTHYASRWTGVCFWPAIMAWILFKTCVLMPWRGKNILRGACPYCSTLHEIKPINYHHPIWSHKGIRLDPLDVSKERN